MAESVRRQVELTSQATQTTVPETGVFLNVLQFLHVQTQLETQQWIFNSKKDPRGPTVWLWFLMACCT